MGHQYKRHLVLDLEDVFKYVPSKSETASKTNSKHTRIYLGHKVKLSSKRIVTFKHKGTTCVCCGIKASFFAVESFPKVPNSTHLNMYGYNEHGHEVLFTIDHIIPKSKGGKNVISNYQTMCGKCNRLKADKINVDYGKILKNRLLHNLAIGIWNKGEISDYTGKLYHSSLGFNFSHDYLVDKFNATNYTRVWEELGKSVKITLFNVGVFGSDDVSPEDKVAEFIVKVK